MSEEQVPPPAPTWQKVIAVLASALALPLYALLVWGCIPPMANEFARHGGRILILALESLPLIVPILAAVAGGRIGRRRGTAVTIWYGAAVGALVGLAIVAVALYSLFAIVAYLFAHSNWEF
jgi:hypothetical protein